jgi:hypothetical protein
LVRISVNATAIGTFRTDRLQKAKAPWQVFEYVSFIRNAGDYLTVLVFVGQNITFETTLYSAVPVKLKVTEADLVSAKSQDAFEIVTPDPSALFPSGLAVLGYSGEGGDRIAVPRQRPREVCNEGQPSGNP